MLTITSLFNQYWIFALALKVDMGKQSTLQTLTRKVYQLRGNWGFEVFLGWYIWYENVYRKIFSYKVLTICVSNEQDKMKYYAKRHILANTIAHSISLIKTKVKHTFLFIYLLKTCHICLSHAQDLVNDARVSFFGARIIMPS